MSQDYREILKRELVERCERHQRYSLRAFARDLGLDPARLSDVLNRKKGLSRSAGAVVAKRLGYSSEEATLFCDLVESQHARSRAARSNARERVEKHLAQLEVGHGRNLTIDAFRVISDWYPMAILQVMKLPSYVDEAAWIARALGIQEVQVEEALERLERLELIEVRDGRRRPTDDFVASPDGVPSDAIRKFHEQVLKKALTALYVQPVAERDFSALTFPVAIEDLPKIRKKIREFTASVSKNFTSSARSNRVYSLSVQMINLTRGELK